MIRHISIKNFATIEKAEIDFHDGLNTITGETGAGKSVAVEAISLALGSRADTAYVRSGTKKAVIQMIAEDKNTEYIITREVSASGKNICRINDEIVTLGHLNALCKKLADIHGQYDHQSLLNPDYHIHLVDLYQKDRILPAKEKVQRLYETYTALRARLKALLEETAKNQREQDFMAYELEELQNAHLQIGEDAELEERIELLQNSGQIYENLAGAYQIASEDECSALSAIKHIADNLTEIASYSQDLSELSQRTNELYYELEDIASSVRDCRDNTVFSPEELDETIERSDLLKRLKNKHGKSIEELITYAQELEEKLSGIENADALKEQLESQLAQQRQELLAACEDLSNARKEAAAQLEQKITEELTQLNFNDAKFSISFKQAEHLTAEGFDSVEFLISTNRGEPLKPLSKIASGGEMSRIMLAFKKITGDYDEIPTMIFDEIDSGISGIAASVVGRKLREIARTHQIICITHLPQIAAFGEHNYKIEKQTDDSSTYTTITELVPEEKVQEIARLLGGATITETTFRSAEELIQSSK